MEEFPANSRKSATPGKDESPAPKKIERVVEGEVIRRKRPLGKRFAETFVGGDARSVWSYVMWDVLIPAAKDTIADATSQGIERLIFGEARSSSRRTGSRPSGGNGFISYNRFAPSSSGTSVKTFREREERIPRRNGNHDFDEIILATRVEAEEVIDRLFDIVSRYNQASVADLYELIGQTGNFTDNKWGWSDIRGAGVTRVRNGYLLDLPRPEPLES